MCREGEVKRAIRAESGVWGRCKPPSQCLGGEAPENLKFLAIQDTFGSHIGLLREPGNIMYNSCKCMLSRLFLS